MENNDYVKNDDIIEMTILVNRRDAFIADYPDSVEDFLDGYNCDDNRVDNVPLEHGIYKCKVKFWFEQGYDDMGYPAPGESEWGFTVISFEKIY